MSARWIPNALTVMRCILAVVSAYGVIAGERFARIVEGAVAGGPALRDLNSIEPIDLYIWPAIALGAFILAALTDWLDGVLARRLDAQSAFGAWLDPIADKLLVGLVLIALAITWGAFIIIVAAAIIILRDVFISWLRARLGGGHALPVMRLAKWKTAFEMAALIVLLALPLTPLALRETGIASPLNARIVHVMEVSGLALLITAALASLWTGWMYWRAAREPLSKADTFN